MKNRLVTLLLLLLFSGSLLAGAHPCQAQETREAAPACHGHEAAPEPSSEDDGSGKHHCEHACHMVALLQVPASDFSAEPRAEAIPSPVFRTLPLFTLPIDHIPLA